MLGVNSIAGSTELTINRNSSTKDNHRMSNQPTLCYLYDCLNRNHKIGDYNTRHSSWLTKEAVTTRSIRAVDMDTLKYLYNEEKSIWEWVTVPRSISYDKIRDIHYEGEKIFYIVNFQDGSSIQATADHLFLTNEGWLPMAHAMRLGIPIATEGLVVGTRRISFPVAFSVPELNAEKWKKVVGYEDSYLISSLGRWMSTLKGKPEYREIDVDDSGYERARLSKNGEVKNKKIHQMVLEAFDRVPEEDDLQVRHGNNNRRDNRLWNLKWGTARENAEDRSKGLFSGLMEIQSKYIICISQPHTDHSFRIEFDRGNHCSFDGIIS